MRDRDALNRFIRMEGRWACDENADRSTVKVEFNVDAAIQTLRAAGFYDNALFLAKRYERHAQFCEIQVEDIDNAKAAMTYVFFIFYSKFTLAQIFHTLDIQPTYICIYEVALYHSLLTHESTRPFKLLRILT